MLAKLTSKNQLTLPKSVTNAVADAVAWARQSKRRAK